MFNGDEDGRLYYRIQCEYVECAMQIEIEI